MIRDKYTYRNDLSRQRKYQLRQRDKGKCIICADKAVNSHFCETHREAANRMANTGYHRRKES